MELVRASSRDERCDGAGSAQRASIIVFARLPVPGRVKTRLAAGVGPSDACDFYRACAVHAISQAASCSDWADVFVYHSSADVSADVASWLRAEGLDLPCRPQLGHASVGEPTVSGKAAAPSASADLAGSPVAAPEPDLGAKMLAAMTEAQRSGIPGGAHKGKVLIMGTDIPEITAQLLRRAADGLDAYEMVVGPSLDGGYYLLGLTRVEPGLFQGMQWSTDSVLSNTLERAAAAGLRVAPLSWLPRLRDVDTVQDLAEWIAACTSSGVHGTSEGSKAAFSRPALEPPGDQCPPGNCGESLLRTAEASSPPHKMPESTASRMTLGADALTRRRYDLLKTSERVLTARIGAATAAPDAIFDAKS